MSNLLKYKSSLGFKYQPNSLNIGYTVIPVLEFLWGKPIDSVAFNYLHALRPSQIRISEGETTTDAWSWRVTVYVYEGTIRRIEQEVEVCLEDCDNGHDLDQKTKQLLKCHLIQH